MTLRSSLRAVASRAPARVFVAATRFDDLPFTLALRDDVRLVMSPRHATVLLVAGRIPARHVDALMRVHDQLPHPRATVWSTAGSRGDIPRAVRDPIVVLDQAGLARAVLDAHREVVVGARVSERDVLADVPPAPWRGVGPYGQGGEGMMGGVPYGRPMAMTADDRDGLALDELHVPVGPFVAALPPGLVLDVSLQGDVVTAASVDAAPWSDDGESGGADAHNAAAPIVTVERARAQVLLRYAGWFLVVHGLDALGRRCWRLARDPAGGPDAIARVRRRVDRTAALSLSTRGVGVLTRATAELLGGPAARASGVARDARANDRAYRALGFEPIVQSAGDAHARFRQWLLEAEQSLRLADAAGPTDITTPADHRGAATLDSIVAAAVEGLEWGQAVTTVASIAPALAAPRAAVPVA